MIEINLEAPDRRKCLQLRASLLFVADDANRMLRIVELLGMATGTGNVRRETYLG